MPLVIAGLYGGAVADTFDRRRVALGSSAVLWLTSVAMFTAFPRALLPAIGGVILGGDEAMVGELLAAMAVGAFLTGLFSGPLTLVLGGTLCVLLVSLLMRAQPGFLRYDSRHPQA